MDNLKVYILIKNPITMEDVSIRGNLEILRAFLSSVGPIENQTSSNPSTNAGDVATVKLGAILQQAEPK